MASDGEEVKVYIYDLSKGMARAMSQAFLGKQLDGIWHTGIVVYGKEFYYGGTGGIECCPPCGTILGRPDQMHSLGKTQIPYEMFVDYLGELSQSTYGPNSYHLLEHNCNTFSSEVAQFLTGNDIPSKITGLPAEVLSTPFGQMIKPFIDSMSVQPSGGHALFPQAPSSAPPTRYTHTQAPALKTGQPPSQSAGATKSGQPLSQSSGATKANDIKLKPFVFNQDIPDQIYWTKSELNVPSGDLKILKEVYEFLSLNDCTWSLGRDHMTLIHRLALDCDLGCEISALQLLSRLVTKEDIVQMLLHDPNSTLQHVLEHYENFKDNVKENVIKMLFQFVAHLTASQGWLTISSVLQQCFSHFQMSGEVVNCRDKLCLVLVNHLEDPKNDDKMTNCCSTPVGCQLLLHDKNRKSTGCACVSALLGECSQITKSAAALAYNLSLGKIPDETELELGSAVLTCLEKDLDESSVYHLLQAALCFIKNNTEVKGLARVLGIDFDKLKAKSGRVEVLCGNVNKLL